MTSKTKPKLPKAKVTDLRPPKKATSSTKGGKQIGTPKYG
jgi:hypothetical protein